MGFFKNVGKILGGVGKKVLTATTGIDLDAGKNSVLQPAGNNILNQQPVYATQPTWGQSIKNVLDHGIKTQNAISPTTIMMIGAVILGFALIMKKK